MPAARSLQAHADVGHRCNTLSLEHSIPSSHCQDWQCRGNMWKLEKKKHEAANRPGGRQRLSHQPRAEPISLCRKRPFATHGRGRPPARAAVCRIPCRILCLAYVERKSMARRTSSTMSPRIGSRIATGVWRCGAVRALRALRDPRPAASTRSLRPACRIRSGLPRRRSVVPCRAHSVGERLPGGGFLARGDAFVYDASQDRGQLDDGVHGDDFGEPAGRGQIRPPGLRCLARYRRSSSPRSGQLIK